MKYPLICTLACIIITSSLNAHANDNVWFGAIKTSIGDTTIENISHNNTIGTGALIGGQIDGRIEDTTIDDYTAGFGFAVGRRFGNWSFEAEYVYRYRTDWDLVAPTPAIQTITNVFSNVETNTLMFNLIRRGVINKNWSWELGGGVGFVSNDIEADYIEREVPGVTPEMVFKDDTRERNFSYNLLVGVTRTFADKWNFNLRYRYIDLGELEAGPFPNRAARIDGDQTSTELQFSIERDF